jgi:AP-1 complex subunit beta-1
LIDVCPFLTVKLAAEQNIEQVSRRSLFPKSRKKVNSPRKCALTLCLPLRLDQVLLEFKEYATEVDVDFVRKAVRAIGRCAISIESAAERCISVLLELIGTKVNYVVQEAIVVIKDIFRRYPNQYEGVIGTLCDSLDTLDEPEAKASMVWIIGEYAERIDNAEELLEAFLDTFLEEAPEVQLQLLTATVKLFLKKPSSGPQALIQTVLNQATTETDDPDLRDRAYIYWRLLSSDPEAAKEVVLASKPMIRDDRNSLDAGLLKELLGQLSTLSSVYYKLPSTFVPRTHAITSAEDGDDDEHIDTGGAANLAVRHETTVGDMLGDLASPHVPSITGAAKPSGVDLLADLMDGIDVAAPAATSGANPVMNVMDLGVASISPSSAPVAPSVTGSVLLQADKGAGLEISGVVVRGTNGAPLYNLTFTNRTQMPLDGFQLQFNKNTFRLALVSQPQLATIAPGESRSCQVPLSFSGQSAGSTASAVLQVAVKSPRQNQAVFYFNDQVPLESVLLSDGRMDNNVFMQQWQSIPNTHEQSQQIPVSPTMANPEAATRALSAAANWFLASQRPLPGQTAVYFSGKAPGPQQEQWILLEITFAPGVQAVKVAVRERVPVQGLANMVFLAIHNILKP